jgi:sulfopyruvate decarboxylase TPP-binding subunit
VRPDSAELVVKGLKAAGINFVSFLPESRLNPIIPVIERDSSFTLVRASHEGTAVSIACGAALAGKRSAAYMEATGFILSLYQQMGIAWRRGVPLLLLVAYVGSPGDRADSMTFSGYAGLGWGGRLEGLLHAMGMAYKIVERNDEVEQRIFELARSARSRQCPTALLFTGEFTEFTGGWT